MTAPCQEPSPAPSATSEPECAPAPTTDASRKRSAGIEARAEAVRTRFEQVPGWTLRDEGEFLLVHGPRLASVEEDQVLQALRSLLAVLRAEFPATGAGDFLVTVRICADESEYLQSGGESGTTGIWSPRGRELILLRDRSSPSDLRKPPGLLVHAWMQHVLGPVNPHPWFSRGLVHHFSRCRPGTDGTLHLASRPMPVLFHGPIREVLVRSQAEWVGWLAEIHDAQAGWIVDFLRGTRNPEWSGILRAYFAALRKGRAESELLRGPPPRTMEAMSEFLEEPERIRAAAWKEVFGAFDAATWARFEEDLAKSR